MFKLEPHEARLLLNIALVAIGRNRFQSAETILSALDRFRPNDASLASARAVMMMSAGDFAGAVEFIDRVGLARHPDSAMLQAFKGMAYLRMGHPEKAAEPLKTAASQAADPAAATLAGDLLK